MDQENQKINNLKPHILIADTNAFIREGLQDVLRKQSFQLHTATDGNDVKYQLNRQMFDVIVLDLNLPKIAGMELLEEISEKQPESHVVILTTNSNVGTAVEAMKKGAFDFLIKPVDLTHIRFIVNRAIDRVQLVRRNRELQDRLGRTDIDDPFRRIVRRSTAMQQATRTVKQVALSDVPVLLRGETGAGKELIARTIHERSRRRDGPFVSVNCGGFTQDLFGSELFGHKRGAFTGAHVDHPGRFTLAEKGTLFLDEIGEVPLKNQVELLRALENREFQPLGDTKVHKADVRIIAATNRNLEKAVSEGEFREDLYYRLNVVPVDVPPLRNRLEDIPLLVETFFEEACRAYDQPRKKASKAAIEVFLSYAWPGNVREMRNVIQRVVITCPEHTIEPKHLSESLGEVIDDHTTHRGEFNVSLGSSIQDVEAELIRQTLQRVTSNRREAAALLGISVRSLQYKIKSYKLT
tara:strand:- start:1972 stop:3372 length:1401 start_codon:yes stop_codon:yes gene_type:complete